MDKKKRYCPFCGSKTNDHTCEICGRNTKSMDMLTHEKELDIIKDDICMDQHDEKKHHTSTNQRPTLHMHNGEHPYYEEMKKKESFSIDTNQIKKGFSTIVAIIMIVISIVAVIIDNGDDEEERSFVYFNDFATYSNEEPANLNCDVVHVGDEVQLVVNNESDQFVAYQLNNEHEEMLNYITYMQPYSTITIPSYGEQVKQCSLIYEDGYTFDYHKPSIDYHIEENDDTIIYQLKDEVREEDLTDLLKYSLSGYAQGNYDGQSIYIEIAGIQAYQVNVSFEEHDIYVTLEAYQNYPDIEDFDFAMTTYQDFY